MDSSDLLSFCLLIRKTVTETKTTVSLTAPGMSAAEQLIPCTYFRLCITDRATIILHYEGRLLPFWISFPASLCYKGTTYWPSASIWMANQTAACKYARNGVFVLKKSSCAGKHDYPQGFLELARTQDVRQMCWKRTHARGRKKKSALGSDARYSEEKKYCSLIKARRISVR